jgi:hypothetical protein
METPRYNIFEFIHKALRALLYDTALTLQRTDFQNKQESEIALKKIESVLTIFEKHAAHEDKHVLPAVLKYDATTVTEIEWEHEKDEALSHRLINKMEAVRFATTEAARIKSGKEIMYLFIEFVGFNLIHMNKEEHIINNLLWENYSDEELVKINNNIRNEISAEEAMFAFKWMIQGLSNLEMIMLLTSVKHSMPADAFSAASEMVKTSLPVERANKVLDKVIITEVFYVQ